MSRPGAAAWPSVAADIDATTVRRAAVWALLVTKLVGGWGLGWDIRWHVLIGRDSFWIPPHVLTYASVAAAVLVALGVVARETWQARRVPAPADTVRIAGLVGTRGFHLVWLGMGLTIIAAPIDDLWHRLFGIDVTLWSSPHLLGLAGAQVSTLALLVVALEVWPPVSPRDSHPADRFTPAVDFAYGRHRARLPRLRGADRGHDRRLGDGRARDRVRRRVRDAGTRSHAHARRGSRLSMIILAISAEAP